VAERRKPRAERSDLVEAVEMVAIGAFASLAAATVVLLIGDWTGWLEPSRIARDAGDYLVAHPLRGLGALLAVLALGYVLALGAAHLSHRKSPVAVAPGATAWYLAFWSTRARGGVRPTAKHLAAVTVELRDNRRVVGMLASFTAEAADDRELVLAAPILTQVTRAHPLDRIDDAFLVLHERDMASISGRFIDPRTGKAEPLPNTPVKDHAEDQRTDPDA
jgi:hypothetical protein